MDLEQRYLILEYSGVASPRTAFANEVGRGLGELPKNLSSFCLYDEVGSAIFVEIMASPAYYLTKCERRILESNKKVIADFINGATIVDLGVGNGEKAEVLIAEEILQRGLATCVPADIDESAVEGTTARYWKKFGAQIAVNGLVADNLDVIPWLVEGDQLRIFAMFLGSNLGNFSSGGEDYLRQLGAPMRPGDRLLLGVDLLKDWQTLINAYSDPEGVTKRFNLNVLLRANRELGSQFDIEQFEHLVVFNTELSRMESYLVSLIDQEVFVPRLNRSFAFKKDEPILMEVSYKYTEKGINHLVQQADFKVLEHFSDGLFMDLILERR